MTIYENYQIKPSQHQPMSLIIVTDGRGGKIPACLEGMFTSVNIAKNAIDAYLTQKESDGKKSNKTVAKSGA